MSITASKGKIYILAGVMRAQKSQELANPTHLIMRTLTTQVVLLLISV